MDEKMGLLGTRRPTLDKKNLLHEVASGPSRTFA
jgi:hypothetical protein